MQKENLWYIEEKKNGLGKGGIIWRRKINGDADQPTDQPGEYKAIRGRDLQQKKGSKKKTKVGQALFLSLKEPRSNFVHQSKANGALPPQSPGLETENQKEKSSCTIWYNFVQSCTILHIFVQSCTILYNFVQSGSN